MCGIKTLKLATVLFVALWPGSIKLAAASDDDQLQYFSTCAGRLSAVMEFQWMFDGAGSEKTAQQRAALIELVEAVMTEDQGRAVLHWRISAKQAQSALLTRATFNDNVADARWAIETADRLANESTSLLLS